MFGFWYLIGGCLDCDVCDGLIFEYLGGVLF